MTSRSPEWISVGNLAGGAGKASGYATSRHSSWGSAELARPRPVAQAHHEDISHQHTHPTEAVRLQRGWPTSMHPRSFSEEGKHPFPHREGRILSGRRALARPAPCRAPPPTSLTGLSVLTRL